MLKCHLLIIRIVCKLVNDNINLKNNYTFNAGSLTLTNQSVIRGRMHSLQGSWRICSLSPHWQRCEHSGRPRGAAQQTQRYLRPQQK